MSRFELNIDWLPAPGSGEAFGPERATWASLEIRIDGEIITRNHPADHRGVESRRVVGGMSALAEWMVDSYMAVRFETHTPFAKSPAFSSRRDGRFPSLRDAARGWPEFVAEQDGVSGDEMGAWQQRHTLGAATSDLALPSITFIPEGAWTGVGLDHLPAALEPSIRFNPPEAHERWPLEPIWLPTTDVSSAFHSFVDRVIRRARRVSTGRAWADWLAKGWESVLTQANDSAEARRISMGPIVASRWQAVTRQFREGAGALDGVLMDSGLVSDDQTLDWLINLVGDSAGPENFDVSDVEQVDWALPPFQEGYRLAQAIRRKLGLGNRPISKGGLSEVLEPLGIETRETRAAGLFRSACWTNANGAVVAVANDDPMLDTEPPRRFAVAAALGRLLSGTAGGRAMGAAHGLQSRVRPTKLANAFAAELLLPIQAIQRQGEGVRELAKEYGISGSAAEWHVFNRSPQVEA